jgi:predicted nucleic acid-binding protein
MPSYVLDTSAIMCVLFQEPGAEQVVEIFDAVVAGLEAHEVRVLMPFIALMEVEYWLLRRLAPGEVGATLLLIESWPSVVVQSNDEWRHEAARVKATASLSLADAWIAALAKLSHGELVHKDPEFEQLTNQLEMLRLPYRNRGR